MRKEPGFASPAIEKLDYGTAIVVMETLSNELEFVVTNEIQGSRITRPGISVFGKFVKVRYKGLEGFIFDGFLSRLVPMHNKEPLDDYFNRAYGQLQTMEHSDNQTEYRRIIYKTGIVHEFERGQEKAWYTDFYFIPGISMNEAYLLINKSRGFEEAYKRQINEGATGFDPGPRKFSRDEIVIDYTLGQETIRGDRYHASITGEFGN